LRLFAEPTRAEMRVAMRALLTRYPTLRLADVRRLQHLPVEW